MVYTCLSYKNGDWGMVQMAYGFPTEAQSHPGSHQQRRPGRRLHGEPRRRPRRRRAVAERGRKRREALTSWKRKAGHGQMGMGQKVNPKIAGKWMFIPLKMVLIGIDPYPNWRTPR